MGFGSATKKISKVADMAEEVYKRLNELREQVQELRKTVRATHDRVDRLEATVERQTAVIEALAEEQGIDVDRVHAEAAIVEAEDTSEAPGPDTDADDSSGTADDEAAPRTD